MSPLRVAVLSLVGGMLTLCACASGPKPVRDAQHVQTRAAEAPARPGVKRTLSGRVLGPDGRPVVGALVAAVPLERLGLTLGRASVWGPSGEEGRFQLELPLGRYAITASAPGLTAAFGASVEVDAGGGLLDVEVTLGKVGYTVLGTVRGADGRPAPGAVVWASRFSGVDGDELHTLADAEGRYALKLEPGKKYAVQAGTDGFVSATQGTRLQEDTTFDLELRPVVIPSSTEEDFIAWLRGAAVPLKTLALGQGFEDLRGLKDVIGDARVVGVGESTHGTHEFFQFRHRLFEYLATERGFTVFVVETRWVGMRAINDYVLTGEGNPSKVLAERGGWVHDTEEMLEFIEWMRRYNADPQHPRKLKFYGLDAGDPPAEAGLVLDYLREVDPGRVKEVETLVSPLTRQKAYWKDYTQLSPEQKARLREGLASLMRRFDEQKGPWGSRTTPQRWAVARQGARMLQQTEEELRINTFARVRDAHMAENVRWILEQEGPDARMVVTAHNGHVFFTDYPTRPMGWHLRQALGRGYIAIGSLFNQGGVHAIEPQATIPDGRMPLKEFTLGAAPAGSLDGLFARAGHPLCVVDLRRASGPASEWVRTRLVTRAVEASFSGNEADTETSMVPLEEYDALFFVDRMTRARPLVHGTQKLWMGARSVTPSPAG